MGEQMMLRHKMIDTSIVSLHQGIDDVGRYAIDFEPFSTVGDQNFWWRDGISGPYDARSQAKAENSYL